MTRRILILLPALLLLAGCSAGTVTAAPTATPEAATIAVPDLVGQPLDEAVDALEALGLEVTTDAVDGSIILMRSNWTVTEQTPAAGTDVAEGELISLLASKEGAASAAPVDGTEFTTAVQTNWGDCISALGAGNLAFAPDASGTPEGYVVATAPGLVLTWNVGHSNTGNVITLPGDDATIAALATVGC